MSDCCHKPEPPQHKPVVADSCHTSSPVDYLFWGSLLAILTLTALAWWQDGSAHPHRGIAVLAHHVEELVSTIWWGVALGIVMVALLSRVPRELVMSLLGAEGGLRGCLRATAAGVLLDLCSHGILMVGSKLYERGASIGQVMAFLIASPWNSFSLTLVLFALIGVPWTLLFIACSMAIALSVGVLFDMLVARGTLPANPHRKDLPADFDFWKTAGQAWREAVVTPSGIFAMLADGLRDSRMVLRWVLLGVLLASLIRTFVSTEQFATYFGASLLGLVLTMVAATIIEVCSEGSTPIAADLVIRAQAPGNGFAFLMAGVATDYTEIMVVKETTASWRLALFMPLLTLPQVFVVAWCINQF